MARKIERRPDRVFAVIAIHAFPGGQYTQVHGPYTTAAAAKGMRTRIGTDWRGNPIEGVTAVIEEAAVAWVPFSEDEEATK